MGLCIKFHDASIPHRADTQTTCTVCCIPTAPSCWLQVPGGSQLGPGCVCSTLALTDHGLEGLAKKAMLGLSVSVGILSTAATSALAHPEDAGFAGFNINLCGTDKVYQWCAALKQQLLQDGFGIQAAVLQSTAMHCAPASDTAGYTSCQTQLDCMVVKGAMHTPTVLLPQ